MDVRKLIQSFRNAFFGIRLLFNTQQNFRIQVFVALAVLAAAAFLGLSRLEWLVALVFIAFVLMLEATNTLIERQLDRLFPGTHPEIKYLKDAMAGVVFIAAILAVVAGVLIFAPHLIERVGK